MKMPRADDDPHGREWPWYRPAAVREAQELIAAGRVFDYGYGPEISALEEQAAESHGRKYALAVNSGSSALLAAFVGLGIGPGDEVVIPTFTFMTCASPLILLGAVPILADSGDGTGNVTADSLRPHISPRTRAVLVTHLFGEACDMESIGALARAHQVAVIEDCSHAHGSQMANGEGVGTRGDVAVYSIGGVKAVTGGLGGLLLTDDETVYDLGCLLSSFKQRSRATIRRPEIAALSDVGLGGNLRISPMAAVLALSHLQDLAAIVATKQHNAELLEKALAEFPGLSPVPVGAGRDRGGRYGVHLQFDEEAAGRTRDEAVRALQRHGTRISEPKTRLLHRSSMFRGDRPPRSRYPEELWRRHFCFGPNEYPVASVLHDSWLALPATFLHGSAEPILSSYVTAVDRAWSEQPSC